MKPRIEKLGTIDCDMVETNPVVFDGTLYRFEYVRPRYYANHTGNSYFRFVEHDTGTVSAPFAQGYHMGCAFVDGTTAYVTAVDMWDGERIDVFASSDLEHWVSRTALNLPEYGIFNTSLCRADGQYVLMYEVGKPAEVSGVRFTARFAISEDMETWELTPPECTYAKDRYTAPHCLRFLNGYYYNFYLERCEGYEQRVVRSKDLVHWEPSPHNPVLRASDEDKRIANSNLIAEQRQRIAAAVNINNSDIDLCEHGGRVIINYSWGNQQGIEHLAEAVYQGTLAQFLAGWYAKEPHPHDVEKAVI
jgi:hypothetical protein